MNSKPIVAVSLLLLAACAQAPEQPPVGENTSSAQAPVEDAITSSAAESTADLQEPSNAALNVPQTYSAQVVQVGGEGSRTVTKTAWATDDFANLRGDDFVSVDFNTPIEIMWTYCAQGYTQSDCQSPTSTIRRGLNDVCGIDLTEMKNTISFNCTLE